MAGIDEQPAANRWLAREAPKGRAYDERWDRMSAEGRNVHGEADFVESLGPASVLDAGCGTGRVAIELDRRGIEVVAVDLDPSMLATARAKAPHLSWLAGDLATVDLGRRFDVVVLAGNVMIFLAPGTEGAVVANMARHLRSDGALVAGFQLPPPHARRAASPLAALDLAAYDRHCTAAGLALRERWSTWDRQPFEGGDYAVSVHGPDHGE
jgi:SAM-dependent methyltransferase